MTHKITRRALFAGLAALPFVGEAAAAKEPEPIQATAGLVYGFDVTHSIYPGTTWEFDGAIAAVDPGALDSFTIRGNADAADDRWMWDSQLFASHEDLA